MSLAWEPVEVDLERPFVVLTAAADVDSALVTEVGELCVRHPGRHRVAIRAGDRVLILGPDWTLDGCDPAIVAGLAEFGRVEVCS